MAVWDTNITKVHK